MSTNQPTLFGAYPWADGSTSAPTLFGSGYTPQTFSVDLADSVAGTEEEIFSTTKPLDDAVALTEAQVFEITQVLADSTTSTDAIANTLQKVLADSGTLSEAAVIFTVKDLSDFLILKEWISIRLNKSITWINPSVNANTFDTLYGKYKFGTVLWGGLKPQASWAIGSRRQIPWTNVNGYKYNS